MSEIASLFLLVIALFIAERVGNFATSITGRKLIGWPVGVLTLLCLVTAGGFLLR